MAKVSIAQRDLHRDAIERAAAALFRERGVDAVNVAEIMQAVDLTHGGFYRHFSSKSDLAAVACRRANQDTAQLRTDWMNANPDGSDALQILFQKYLSERHRERIGQGCPIAALSHDVIRGPADSHVKREYVSGLLQWVAEVSNHLSGASDIVRQQALTIVATMVGALTLARASASDQDLSREILHAAQASLVKSISLTKPAVKKSHRKSV